MSTSSSSPTLKRRQSATDDDNQDDDEMKKHLKTQRTTVVVTSLVTQVETGVKNGPLSQALFEEPSSLIHDPISNITYFIDFSEGFEKDQVRCIDHNAKPEPLVTQLTNFSTNWSSSLILLIPERFRTKQRHFIAYNNYYAGRLYSISSDGQQVIPLLFNVTTEVILYNISGMSIDSIGRVVIVDKHRHYIHIITLGLENEICYLTTIAGNGRGEYLNHVDPFKAGFKEPHGICIDDDDHIYVVDRNNHRIRRMDSKTGAITTFPHEQLLFQGGPQCIVWESQTKVFFVIDLCSIKMISKNGMVSSIAGSDTTPGCLDGAGENARFRTCSSLAIETVEHYSIEWVNYIQELPVFCYWPPGLLNVVLHYLPPTTISLLVADPYNSTIRRVLVTTL